MYLRHSILCRSLLILGALASVMPSSSIAEAGSKPSEARKPVITKPKFDPSAERVEFFKGMEDGQLETQFVPKDASGGFLLVKNTTEEPVTVDLPEAFVAVQVLKQFGGGGMGGGGMGGGGMGGGGMGGQLGGGVNKNAGGGLGGGGMGGGGMGGGGMGGGGGGQGGGGFFSIPPERTVRVPYVSACLNHGKPDPSARLEYKLVPVEEYTKDEVLAELIRMVGTGRVNQHSAQAAIWTRTDNMSWQKLAAKNVRGILSVEYYFNAQNIREGQLLMAAAEGNVREKSQAPKKSEANEAGSPRVR
ncbi:MAG: hypothetical protein WKF77_06615 [Planctomycetaceae bacterium]